MTVLNNPYQHIIDGDAKLNVKKACLRIREDTARYAQLLPLELIWVELFFCVGTLVRSCFGFLIIP